MLVNDSVRSLLLLFQLFIKHFPTIDGKHKEKKVVVLSPLLSNVIQNEKHFPLPEIRELSDDTSPAQGKKKLIIVAKKVNPGELNVVFEQVDKGNILQSAWIEEVYLAIHGQ